MAQNENPVPPAAGKGDLWGGVSAMLVALPSSIAYGVTTVAVLGPAYLAQGALAGVIGAVTLGFSAACLGSARQLISAPCAPAAAILSALAVSFVAQDQPGQVQATQAARVLLLITLVGVFSAIIQIVFGVARGGRLIKYIPYPVVAGYLSGVGLMIILAQAPKVFGLHAGPEFWSGLLHPGHWNWNALLVGGLTMLGMILAPRLSKSVPAAIIGLGQAGWPSRGWRSGIPSCAPSHTTRCSSARCRAAFRIWPRPSADAGGWRAACPLSNCCPCSPRRSRSPRSSPSTP